MTLTLRKKLLTFCSMTTMLSLLISGNMAMPVSAEETTNNLLGDVNADGEFNVCDVVTLQKWISGKGGLPCWQNADFTGDGIVNIFDLCYMKKELIHHIKAETYPVENPVVIDEFIPCTATIDDCFVDYMIEITIKKQYTTTPRRIWTIEDFKGIDNIVKITDDTAPELPGLPYRQTLTVFIEACNHEEVLKIIYDIEQLGIEEIYMVRPLFPLGVPEPQLM